MSLFVILTLIIYYAFHLRGGGANGYFFVKLDFEIVVDQQTRTSDRTFEGVPDPNRQTVPTGQPRPYLVQIRPNSEFCQANFGIWPPNFFGGLNQKSAS